MGYQSIEEILYGPYNLHQVLYGTPYNDFLFVDGAWWAHVDGRGGDDFIVAQNSHSVSVSAWQGDDTVYAFGNDVVSVHGAGVNVTFSGNAYAFAYLPAGDNDVNVYQNDFVSIITGNGNDEIDIYGESGQYAFVSTGGGEDILRIGGDVDVTAFLGEGNDAARGGSGDDVIFGDGGDDIIDGRGGNDILFGDNGNDAIFGGDGFNLLFGGEGNDLLVFTPNDVSFGGSGADRFTLNDSFGNLGHAHIADFNPWEGDTLDLSHAGVWSHDLYSMPDGTLVAHSDWSGMSIMFHGVPAAYDFAVITADETLLKG